jgi:hypothetical protein
VGCYPEGRWRKGEGNGENFFLRPDVMKRGEECFSDPLFITKGGVRVFSDTMIWGSNEKGF